MWIGEFKIKSYKKLEPLKKQLKKLQTESCKCLSLLIALYFNVISLH